MSAQIKVVRHLDPNLAVKTFFADPEWVFKTFIGSTFNALSLLAVALNQAWTLPLSVLLCAMVCGYMLKVMRSDVSSTARKLPEWRDWVDIIISGLSWIAVATGFWLIVLSILTVSFIVEVVQGSGIAHDPRFITWAVTTFTLVFVVSLFVSLLTCYLQVNLAQEERMPAAFALRKVTQKFRKKGTEMLEAWLLSIALNSLAIIIPVCTIFGICLIPVTSFIASTISATMLAQAFND